MTQWRSCALTSVNTHSLALMHTQRSCALNGCSGAVHTHSLGFMHTQWVFRGCSHSLIGIHAQSQVFRKCSTCVQPVHGPEGPMNMFWIFASTQRPYKLALNFCWIPFLWLHQARRHDVTNRWLGGGLDVPGWDWQQKIRIYCKNLEN